MEYANRKNEVLLTPWKKKMQRLYAMYPQSEIIHAFNVDTDTGNCWLIELSCIVFLARLTLTITTLRLTIPYFEFKRQTF